MRQEMNVAFGMQQGKCARVGQATPPCWQREKLQNLREFEPNPGEIHKQSQEEVCDSQAKPSQEL